MNPVLWSPSHPEKSQMYEFASRVRDKYDSSIDPADYASLHRWSVANLDLFWKEVADYCDVRFQKPAEEILQRTERIQDTQWFPGARLNFAENLLKHRDDRPALISIDEVGQEIRFNHNELYAEAARYHAALKRLGLQPGDRVAAYLPNRAHTVLAMLGATSLGGVFSSASPDFGVQAVLDRFGQIKPRVLFSCDGYFFKGKWISILDKVKQIATEIDSLEAIVVVPGSSDPVDVSDIPGATALEDFLSDSGQGHGEIDFVGRSFMDPVYIMYSSGTTGLPKCMVQGQGVLLNHLKEHVLHCDLRSSETTFYFTTCGWMMWNWLVSALASGACVLLFDGNPFHPGPEALFRLAEKESVNVFGTSARYFAALEQSGYPVSREHHLDSMRLMLSTGSPLLPEQFDYIYDSIKSDVQLASISGGTDLNGCFALGNPLMPVRRGEIQAAGLGMKVEIKDENGNDVTGNQGELTCTEPFPSMPLYFWNDPDGSRYHSAYFDVWPNVWTHGDFALRTESGGFLFLGRSDATLNPGGVRIGTADIYRIVESLSFVEDSVVIGQNWKGDVRVVLFVKLAEDPGRALKKEEEDTIRKKLRQEASPRHVPAVILSVSSIPYTRNMKKVEIAVREIVEGRSVKNKEALSNPECLLEYQDLAFQLQKDG
ncbi:MAG: acetoacetate--CoA ligase [Spirochaetaceae bacterium]|nr:acetoacetate--CoA ligase [Spirochaetaceae bacterium]|tara:strand:+ start:6789 stop:8759 length:1971 start_codon:yes stop_codon:yes gene_type:complete